MDEEAIRRKILEKVLTFTSNPKIQALATVTEDQSADDSNLDPALLNPSDADLSGCSRVVAKSIEGEDDLVDVHMQDATQDRAANQDANEYVIDLTSRSMHWQLLTAVKVPSPTQEVQHYKARLD